MVNRKEKDFIFTKTKADESHTISITPRDVLFFKDVRGILAVLIYFYKPIALSVAVLCYPLFLAIVIPVYSK
jgi:hypothetical protein